MSADFWEICPHCSTGRERHVNLKTARYEVLFPSHCPHKDQCEAELMRGWGFTSDREIRRRNATEVDRP